MKTLILSVIFLILTGSINAQQNNYYMSMCKTLPQYSECKTSMDYQKLGDSFNEIAMTDTTRWLAAYYYAHAYIVSSLMEPAASKMKDSLLDKVAATIHRLTIIAENEAEVWALSGMYYSARLLVDPEARAYTFLGLSNQSLEKALELDPQNPRARLLVLKNEIGTSKYFGGAIQEYCQRAKQLYESWDNYKVKSKLHPAWGKGQLSSILAECHL